MRHFEVEFFDADGDTVQEDIKYMTDMLEVVRKLFGDGIEVVTIKLVKD